MEGCRLTLGASGPPGMPRDGGAARDPLQGQSLGRWECVGNSGLQPSVLNSPRRGGCLGLSAINIASCPRRLLGSPRRQPWGSRRRRCLPSDEPLWGRGGGWLWICLHQGRHCPGLKECPVGCVPAGFLSLTYKMARHRRQPYKGIF